MSKIERIDIEILKAKEKIAEFQAKIRTLEGQRTDEENAQIVQMVRKLRMTPADLSRFLDRHKNSLMNPTKTPPVTAAIIKNESEDTPHEKN